MYAVVEHTRVGTINERACRRLSDYVCIPECYLQCSGTRLVGMVSSQEQCEFYSITTFNHHCIECIIILKMCCCQNRCEALSVYSFQISSSRVNDKIQHA